MKPSDVMVLSERIPSLLPLLFDRQSSSFEEDFGTRKFSPVRDKGRPELDADDVRLPKVPFDPSWILMSIDGLVSEATTLETETEVVAGVKVGLRTLETLLGDVAEFSRSNDLRLGDE